MKQAKKNNSHSHLCMHTVSNEYRPHAHAQTRTSTLNLFTPKSIERYKMNITSTCTWKKNTQDAQETLHTCIHFNITQSSLNVLFLFDCDRYVQCSKGDQGGIDYLKPTHGKTEHGSSQHTWCCPASPCICIC